MNQRSLFVAVLRGMACWLAVQSAYLLTSHFSFNPYDSKTYLVEGALAGFVACTLFVFAGDIVRMIVKLREPVGSGLRFAAFSYVCLAIPVLALQMMAKFSEPQVQDSIGVLLKGRSYESPAVAGLSVLLAIVAFVLSPYLERVAHSWEVRRQAKLELP